MLSKERVKSPPPVSMQTQRKMVSTQTGSHVVIPPSRTPPVPPQHYESNAQPPNRTPPQPPPHFSPPLEKPDHWKEQKGYWADRRKSAGEALQGRKSMEMRRPESTRPSFEYQQRPQALKSHHSWDASQQRWDGYGSGTGTYDHTYGSYSYEHNKENWDTRHHPVHPLQQHPYQAPTQQYHQDDYYDGPSYDEDFQREQRQLPQAIHRRQTSTSEMLILDRFAGGLDYGYEPGVGLGGSAGTRNAGKLAGGGRKSVDVSMRYGVDFSDVPVFLQRVKVEA